MKKTAFTLAEIMIAIVTMSIVVSVVVPITRDKLQKVDYASYYLGYKTMQTISTEVLPPIVEEIRNEECLLEFEDVCFTSYPEKVDPMSYNDCIGGDGTPGVQATAGTYAQSLGITSCYYDNDYWAGAVQRCEHIDKLVDIPQLSRFQQYFVSEGSFLSEVLYNLGIELDENNQFSMWSKSVSDAQSTWRASYNPSFTTTLAQRNKDNFYTMCVKPMPDPGEYTTKLINGIANTFSIKGTANHATTIEQVQSAVTSKKFNGTEPHIVLINGIRIYIGAHYGNIPKLADSSIVEDKKGWLIYLDVNGTSGRSRLYEDVYPFYLLKSGKVIPDFETGNVAGASSEENLSVQVLYDEFDDVNNRRLEKRLIPAVTNGADPNSFKSAACAAGYIQSSTYCGFNPADATLNPNTFNCIINESADCRIKVKAPIRILK